jgi:hypothetical protein
MRNFLPASIKNGAQEKKTVGKSGASMYTVMHDSPKGDVFD